MMKYKEELWLGRLKSGVGWNWVIRGWYDDDDYESRAKACERFIEEIESVKQYLESLIEE